MFTVRFVDESALPRDQVWVIGVDGSTGQRFLFIKRGARSSTVLEEVWAAGHRLDEPDLRVAV